MDSDRLLRQDLANQITSTIDIFQADLNGYVFA